MLLFVFNEFMKLNATSLRFIPGDKMYHFTLMVNENEQYPCICMKMAKHVELFKNQNNCTTTFHKTNDYSEIMVVFQDELNLKQMVHSLPIVNGRYVFY